MHEGISINELKKMDKVKINMDLSDLLNPGLYKITCTVNKKQYIGESFNTLSRIGRHTDSLLKKST